MTIIFRVPGNPVGKERPRFSAGRTYTPEKTAVYQDMVRAAYAREAHGRYFAEKSPLQMAIGAYYAIPKSASKSDREKMLRGKILPTKKPDLDNIAKIIADALNGAAYKDDSQIASLNVEKYYSENPCVVVMISSFPE